MIRKWSIFPGNGPLFPGNGPSFPGNGPFILGKMDTDKSYNVSIGHSNTLPDGEKLKEIIQKNHSNLNSIYLMDLGCALGVHAGPGSLAVGLQPTS